MNKVLVVGEVKIGEKGCVLQGDLAQAMGVERLTSIPKDTTGVSLVVGRLLGNREPETLVRAKALGLTIKSVDDVMNDDVRAELRTLLAMKSKRATYEQAALDYLNAMTKVEAKPEPKAPRKGLDLLADVFPMPRKGKKSKAA